MESVIFAASVFQYARAVLCNSQLPVLSSLQKAVTCPNRRPAFTSSSHSPSNYAWPLTSPSSASAPSSHLDNVGARKHPIRAVQTTSTSPSTADSTTKPASMEAAPPFLPEQWREIQGEKHWKGLVDHPINETLRAEIIRYGQFAQVTYDSFDFNEHSLYCGSCKYSRSSLFEKVDRGNCGYEVTKYLYATSELDLPKFFKKSEKDEDQRWSRDSNWIGYIAVCTDEAEVKRIGRRDILIAWRGTVTSTEWIDDIRTTQAPAAIEIANGQNQKQHTPNGDQVLELKPATAINIAPPSVASKQAPFLRERVSKVWLEDSAKDVKVEIGFLSLYTSSKAGSRFNKLSAGQQMAVEVKRLLEQYEGEEISISITGHSLGAALAILSAYDIAANIKGESSAPAMITVFTFGGPRVGNKAFKKRVEELGVRVLRVVNEHDCVPKVPGALFNEHSFLVWPFMSAYYHVGTELRIDFDLSPHLTHTRDLPSHHNLEAHLHVMDGFHGLARPFKSVFGRDPILVNKSSDFLRKGSYIPSSWWQESNKGMVKDPSSGQWVLAPRNAEHLPEIHHP